MPSLSENAERELRQQVKDIVENDYGILVYFHDEEEDKWVRIIREGGEACGNDFSLCFVRSKVCKLNNNQTEEEDDKVCCKIFIKTFESENDKLLVWFLDKKGEAIIYRLVKPEDLTEVVLRVLILRDDYISSVYKALKSLYM